MRRAHLAAFGRPRKDHVGRLRERAPSYLGLVVLVGDVVTGYIAFTPVTLAPPRFGLSAVGLAPMAAAPERQRTGVGSARVATGLTA